MVAVKVTNGDGGYGYTRDLSKETTAQFLHRVQALDYWNLPTREEKKGTIGVDGAQWILEGVQNGKYKVVDRWSPRSGPVRDLGLAMVHLAGLRIPSHEIY